MFTTFLFIYIIIVIVIVIYYHYYLFTYLFKIIWLNMYFFFDRMVQSSKKHFHLLIPLRLFIYLS